MPHLSELRPEQLMELRRRVDALLELDLPDEFRWRVDTFRADILGYLEKPARPAIWPQEPLVAFQGSEFELSGLDDQ